MKFKGFWYDGLMIFLAAAIAAVFIVMTALVEPRLAVAECIAFVLVCVIGVYRALSAKNRYRRFLIKTSKKLDLSRLYGAGGMPSSHSSLVSTLVVMALRTEGIGSTAFAISFALAIIVMYDATGVRRQAGEHAKRINILIEEWMTRNNMKIDNNLKELLGHTPFEVIMGAILGIIIGIIYPI